MAFFSATSKADFQHQLKAALAQHVSDEFLPQVGLFAEQFFGITPLTELTQRRMSDLVGSTLATWRLLEHREPDVAMVNVFNPDYEKHGWQSTHTVVEVLHPDMPFLVDSVRMELTRRRYSIHTLQNSVLQVCRDADDNLVELLPKGCANERSKPESLIFLEISDSGFNLFVIQSLTGRDLGAVARASLPFFGLIVLAAIIITAFPDIVLFLPQMVHTS